MKQRVNKLKYRLCPHWWSAKPDVLEPVMFDVEQREHCQVCGKERVHIRLPKPHPTREFNPEERVAEMSKPGLEYIVLEWLPHDSKDP